MTDQLDGRPQIRTVDDDDIDTAQHVAQSHHRHEHATDTGDALHATQYHGTSHDTDEGTRQVGRYLVTLLGHGGNGVRLYRVADAKGSECREDGKEDSHPLPAETFLKRIHRTTEHLAALRLLAVFDGQQPLRIFCRDTEYTCQPAPQHGSRTTQGNGRCHAHDVTCSDGGSQRSGQRAELRHVTCGIRILTH